MANFDYVLLDDSLSGSVVPQAFRSSVRKASAAFLGTTVLLTAGWRWLTIHAGRYSKSSASVNHFSDEPTEPILWEPFYPKEGMDEVLVRPGMPSGPLQVLPPHVLDGGGASCIVSYTHKQSVTGGAMSWNEKAQSSEECWIYGASLSAGERVAEPTGNAGDIVKARLVCWAQVTFLLSNKLKSTDRLYKYDPSEHNQAELRRAVVKAVRKDGTTELAYWYYQDKTPTKVRDRFEQATGKQVRLDKWVWAARFFKSRPLVVEALNGGKIKINGERPKPSRDVKVGDEVWLRIGDFEYTVTVKGISDKRGPASQAAQLYQETPASVASREQKNLQLKALYAS
eukprot:g49739.t1